MPRELLTMTGTYTQFEGTNIVAENCLGAKVRDLVIKGKTYQNLCSKLVLYQGPVDNGNNLRDKRVSSENFSLKVGKYTIIMTDENIEIALYPNYKSTSSSFISWTNCIVWDNTSEGNNIKLAIRKKSQSNITVDEVTGKIILLEGDYTNIDLPNSINGIESVAEGDRNLVNTATIYASMRESGSVGSLFNPRPDGGYDVYMMKIQPNTEYLINLDGFTGTPWIRIYDENYKIVKSGNAASNELGYTWSAVKPGNNQYYLEFNKPKSFTGTFRVYRKENEYPLKLAVNEEINFINLPIPLRSLPNGTCDTIEGNRLVQRVGKVVLDGTQSFTINNVNQSETTRGYFQLLGKESRGCNNLICNWYIRNGNHGDYEYIMISNNALFISVLNSKLETTNENGLKKYFSENPLSVYYELTTPITHSLEIPSISTIRGTDVVTTDNNIKPVINCKLRLSKARITS